VSCSSSYTPEGWTGDAWTGDAWAGDAWQSSYSRTNNGSSGSSKLAFWGIGAGLCALVAGAALFMTRKKNESNRDLPRDVYVEAEDESEYHQESGYVNEANCESKRTSVKSWFKFGRKASTARGGALV